MAKTSTTIEISKGQHIFYRNENYIDDLEFVVLDYNELCCACISDKPIGQEMPFDIHNHNKWEISSLRKYLNEEYVKKFNKDDLEPLDGDHVTLLSKEEIKIYKDILPKYSTYWWTRSPEVLYATYVWLSDPDGRLISTPAMYKACVIPACLFNLQNITILQERNNIVFES